MSQPEWMKVYNQMGLKGQVVTTVDDKGSVVQTAPPGDSDAANAPSRFEKFEHKPKERANSSTPPWMANLKKNQQKTPIVEDTTAEEDAAALFAAAALGPPVVAKAPVVDDEEDAAALFHMSANIPAVVHDSDELTVEEEEMSSRYRKMLQMGMPEGAVSQKMLAEGIPQHVQDAVFAPPPAPAPAPAPSSLATGPLGAPQPEPEGDDHDEESIEEEIIEDEEVEEEEMEEMEEMEESVESSLVASAVMKSRDPPAGTESEEDQPHQQLQQQQRQQQPMLPSAHSSPSSVQKMTDEEFGEPWVVDKDRVVQYEEVYVDDDGNEVVVPQRARDVEVVERQQVTSRQAPIAPVSQETPEQYVEPVYDPAYDIENQKKLLNRGTNAYRSKMAVWVPIAFMLASITAALLIVFLVALKDDEGIDVRSIPTFAPTPRIVIPVEPTNTGFIDVAITTPFDPITTDCDFSNSVQPHVITQCACSGNVVFIADDVRKRYESLASNFVPSVMPDFAEPISSCDPANQALIWLSTGSNNAGESDAFVRQERYALAYFFLAQGGIAWADNTNWLSEVDVCDWFGITCDSKGAVVSMDMSNNRVIGQLSPFIVLLDYLESFNAPSNRMEGTMPAAVLASSSLRFLDLSSNFLFGGIPRFPSESKLEIINLSGNNLSKQIPSTIGNVKSLISLNLSRNAFSSGIPSELFSLPLQELYLEGNSLSGTIPDGFSGLSELSILTLGSNQFTGEIPSALGSVSTLTRLLIVDVPTLGGRLPASFGTGLTNLVEFILTDTSVEGNIPVQFGQMTALESLDLSRNSLVQELPTELGLLTNLKLLYLENNLFTGAIPEELGNAVAMTELKLTNNQLVGSVPSTIGQMSNLVTLNLDGNFLDGRAPEEICNLREDSLEEFTVDCPERLSDVLVTGIICSIPSCCTACT